MNDTEIIKLIDHNKKEIVRLTKEIDILNQKLNQEKNDAKIFESKLDNYYENTKMDNLFEMIGKYENMDKEEAVKELNKEIENTFKGKAEEILKDSNQNIIYILSYYRGTFFFALYINYIYIKIAKKKSLSFLCSDFFFY